MRTRGLRLMLLIGLVLLGVAEVQMGLAAKGAAPCPPPCRVK